MLMFGFMYSGYKDQFWWWECMSLVRKLFMSLVLVFFSEQLYIQLFLGLIVCQFFLLLQLRFMPFTNDLCNIFETLSLFALWFTLQGTFLYFEGVSIGVNLVITACLALINFGVILFFVLSYFYQTLEDKKDAIRGPLAKVGIDIDRLLEMVKKFNKDYVETAVTKTMMVNAFSNGGKGGKGAIIDLNGIKNCPQLQQIETLKKVMEVYDVSEATDEKLKLVQEIHLKLEEILSSDEALRLSYASPLMEGIADYVNRLRSDTGSSYVNPLSQYDSLGQTRGQREHMKAYGQTGLMDGISYFLGRHRSETGGNFQNPLADAAEEVEGGGVGMDVLAPQVEPNQEDVPAVSTLLMDDISTFLTRFRSETGRNFQNPLAEEAAVGVATVGPEVLNAQDSVAVEINDSTMKDIAPGGETNDGIRIPRDPNLEDMDDAARRELENLELRRIETEALARNRATTLKPLSPSILKPTKVDDGIKSEKDYLQSIDNELLRILNWRSEIAESGRYKPLTNGDGGSKVKHIHRQSVHAGRQRALGGGGTTITMPVQEALGQTKVVRSPLAPVQEELEEAAGAEAPPGTPASEAGSLSDSVSENQSLLSSQDRKDSSMMSMNPLATARWKKAVNVARVAEYVANPLQTMGASSSSRQAGLGPQPGGSTTAMALPATLTLSPSGKFPATASGSGDDQPASAQAVQGERSMNPMFSLPTSLTIKKSKKQKKKQKK